MSTTTTQVPMHTDARIICQKGRYALLEQCQEVPLRDGSITKLHMVQETNVAEPARFLRAIAGDVAGTFVFDVRDLAQSLDLDIRQLPRRDSMGVVALTLRQRFPTAASLRFAIVESALISFRDGLASENSHSLFGARMEAQAA